MEDKLLIWKLNRGNKDALCRIYEKYRDDLVRIAAGLVNDISTAEDIVQDVFLTMVHSADKYRITKNLKGYLTTCIVNRIKSHHRVKKEKLVSIDDIAPAASPCDAPDHILAFDEQSQKLYDALALLPYEQKETLILRIQAGLKFKDIAKLQDVSIKTTLSRFTYGLDKLRSILNSEVKK